MGNRPSRAERLELVRNKLSRRDFAKYSSLSAVAIAIASRSNTAEAAIDISKLKVGNKCRKFLEATPEHFKTSALVYGDFGNLLGKLSGSGKLDAATKAEIDKLKTHVNKFEKKDGFIAPRLCDLYCYDSATAPSFVKHPVATAWKDIYTSVGKSAIKDHLAIPFANLPPRADDSRRSVIQEFLASPVYDFKGVSRRYTYRELFTKSVVTLYGRDWLNNPDYRTIRIAFDLGLFDDSSGPAPLSPNDECWDTTAGECVEVPGSDYYCEEDTDGYPTSASDICP